MRIVRLFAIALVIVSIGAFVIGVVVRFQDGPWMAFPGGPFVSGKVVSTKDIEWEFLRDVDTVELELLSPPQSRTTWILYHGGAIFIPCGIPDFTLWKKWPHQALEDGRARLRHDGKIYDVQLSRIDPGRLYDEVGALMDHKYGLMPDGGDSNTVWIFRLDPRS